MEARAADIMSGRPGLHCAVAKVDLYRQESADERGI